MGLGIQKKLMLSYGGIGATVALVSAVALVSLRGKVSRLGASHAPALYAVQDLQSRATFAVKESFAYLATGEASERAEFERELAELDERFDAYRAFTDEDVERRLYAAIVSERRALVEEARRLFEARARTGPLHGKELARYEQLSESLVRKFRALVEWERREVTEAYAEATSALALALKLIAGVGVAALAVSAGVGHVFGRRLVRPIRALQQAAIRLGEGSQTTPVPPEAHDELADVVRAFNAMALRVQAGKADLQSQVEERTAEIQRYASKLEASLAALREAQASLVASERLAAVGMLAAGVGHEINNPLSYIMASLSYVREELSRHARATAQAVPGAPLDTAELLDAVEEARHGTEKVRNIVRNLKTISSRGTEERTEPVDVNRVVDLTLRMAGTQIRHKATVVNQRAPGCFAQANESRLTQVLLNLVINAVQALPESSPEPSQIGVATRTQDDVIVIEVSDNGCGIAAADLGKIWEPFYTTKPVGVGTGLGLPICRSLVESMGGTIAVESKPGQGSVFRVTVPAAVVAPSPSAPEVSAPPPSARRGLVLVIDDDPHVCASIERSLPGDDVLITTSGREALRYLSARAPFDAVLCDVMMPGLSGMELHRELSRIAPEYLDRLLFMTGGAFTPEARAFLDRVQAPVLEKPLDPDALRDLVRRAVQAEPVEALAS